MNKAKASGGDRVNMLTNAYANKGIIMYWQLIPIKTGIGLIKLD
jgi:hypothetical protein